MPRKRKGSESKGTRRYYAHDVFHRNTGWPVKHGHIHHSNGCPYWIEWIAEGQYDFHNLELFLSNSAHILRHRTECSERAYSQQRVNGLFVKETPFKGD